jgi:hypothetical protein
MFNPYLLRLPPLNLYNFYLLFRETNSERVSCGSIDLPNNSSHRSHSGHVKITKMLEIVKQR